MVDTIKLTVVSPRHKSNLVPSIGKELLLGETGRPLRLPKKDSYH